MTVMNACYRQAAIRVLALVLIVASILLFAAGFDAVPLETFVLIIVLEILFTLSPLLTHEVLTGCFFRLHPRGPPLR